MTAALILVGAVYLAATVEAIETFSVALAVSISKGWRPAVFGVLAGTVILAAFVAAGGIPLLHYVPLRVLQGVMGAGALWIGQKWIRKAVLRASGRKALHNEDATFAESEYKLGTGASGFRMCLGTTLLEGTEVILIVGALGIGAHRLLLASLTALVAIVVVAIVGGLVARPLAKIPENSMKLAVSVLLLSMGAFWLGECAGLHWPGADAMILAIVAVVAGLTYSAIQILRKSPSKSTKPLDIAPT